MSKFRLKNGLLVAFFAALVCISWSVTFAGGVLIDDNFNNGKTGEQPAGYLIEDAGGKVSIAEVPSASDKSLFLDDPGSSVIKITKKFTPQTGIVTAEVSFMQDNAGSTAKVLRLLDAEAANAAVHIETRSNVFSYKKADGSFIPMMAYAKQTWYKITVVADVKTQKADVYIDGEEKIKQADFCATVANIGAVDSFTPGSSGKGHYLDNLKVVEGAMEISAPKAAASNAAASDSNAAKSGDGLIAELSVKDKINANFWSIQKNLQVGDQQLGDRSFTIKSLPPAYAGYDWIRTAGDSKSFGGDVLVTFKVTKDADVFVGFDDRVSIKPDWLKDWVDTGDDIVNTDPNEPSFSLYKKHFPAGSTVSLGPNGQISGCIQYMIIVKGPDKPTEPVKKEAPLPTIVTWKGILGLDARWFGTDEAIRIADNVLLFQRDSGGWYKYRDHNSDDYDIAIKLTDADKAKYLKDKSLEDGTIDNGSTYTHLRYLAKVYNATKIERFKEGFLKGFDYLLKAQYPNGGWPQYYPDKSLYRARITYNDDAMVNVLKLMREIGNSLNPEFDFVDKNRREKAVAAVNKGILCILNTQIKVDGKLTAWCAQHDEKTLAPAPARSYELESISGSESLGILRFLMSLDRPGPRVKQAIHAGVAWLNEVKLTGIQVVEKVDPSKPKGYDKFVVNNPKAPPTWARFYEIGTNRPFFCGRDGVKKYSLAEIDYERRVGYSWYTDAPAALLEKDYPAWQSKWDPKNNVLK